MLAGRHHGCNCVTDKCFCTTLREMAGCECPSLHTRFQELSFIIPSVLLQDLHHAVVRFLISLLVCAVPGLYVITLHHLSYRRLNVLTEFVSKHL